MFLIDTLPTLNWWAVLLAAVSSFAVGAIWYARPVLGRAWMKEIGVDPDNPGERSGMALVFVGVFVASFLTAVVLATIFAGTGTTGLLEGFLVGAVIGLVVRGGAHVIHNGFAGRSATLTTIDVAHDTVAIAIMGAIIGVWP